MFFGDGGGHFVDGGGTVPGLIFTAAGADFFHITTTNIRIQDSTVGDGDQVTTSVSYQLGTNPEQLTLVGSAVAGTGNSIDNSILGHAGANALTGLAGNDTLSGASGADLLGGTGNALLCGGDENDILNGGTLNDILWGDDGDDVLRGMTGNDALTGGIDDDTLFGGAGNGALTGGDGDDMLYGGAGADTLQCGLGADTFVFAKGDTGKNIATRDTIATFFTGVDRPDLSRLDANTTNANPNDANPNDACTYLNTGAFTNLAVQLHVTGTGTFLVLEGVTNGNGFADFQIGINGLAALAFGDIILCRSPDVAVVFAARHPHISCDPIGVQT